MARRLLGSVLALVLVAAACSSEAAPETTTTLPPSTTTTTTAPATTTTLPPSTTTSTIAYAALDVSVPDDPEVGAAVQSFYAWFGDRTLPTPQIPDGMVEFFSDKSATTGSNSFTGSLTSSEVGEFGSAGVVEVNGTDIVLVVNDAEAEGEDDTGWRVVGAWLKQYDLEPWFGNPVRHVFVIGTDARPGELEPHLRADSLHILSSNIADRAGGVLGIPRDLRVEASYGVDKYTNVNALVYTLSCGRNATDDSCTDPNAGQNEMVEIAREFSGLPLEGWIVTGFLGFQRLVDAFGGIEVDVPVAMAEPNADAYFPAGLQTLFGADALAMSRNRKQFGAIGDFVRSLHQGMLVLGALDSVQEQDMNALPDLLGTLTEFTSTNLSLEDLLTLAAGALVIDFDQVGNEVVPSTGGLQGGAYYANFTEDAEPLFRDLDDGSLTPADSWLKGRYGDE